MLMSSNKKKPATLIISKLSDKLEKAPMTDDGAELDQSLGYDSAAEEILAAIESKDKSALKEALKSMIQMCMDEEEDSEEEYSESSEPSEA